MSLDAYISGTTFEKLLRKVYPSNQARSLQSLMRNAISMEQGEDQCKNLGSSEKQFQEAKEKLEKTIIKISCTDPYTKESPYFDSYLSLINDCNTSQCLMQVVTSALERANRIDNNA